MLNQPKIAEIYEVDVVTGLVAQVAALTKKINAMGMQPIHQMTIVCKLCAGNHASSQCAITLESVHYIGSNNRQQRINSNTYNPRWRNHPNFSWSNNQGQSSAPRQFYPPGF